MSIKEQSDENWTHIIKPSYSLFDLNLKDVWRYRDLIGLFVKRDFVAAYKQTILGPLWHFIQPLFTTAIFLLVFTKIARIPTDGINPVLFYMSGITLWNYFSSCLMGTSNTFGSNAGIFGKVYFPRLVSPISTVISNLMKFGIQFLLLIVVMIWFAIIKGDHFYFGWSWLLIFPLLIILAGLGLGLGIIISALTTKYRDFSVLIGFGIQLAMYATPVVYPLSFIADKSYKWLIIINPMTYIMEAFRFALFHQGTMSVYLLYSVSFTVISLFVGLLMFNKVERSFMDTV
ncbi:MAG: ABC transporter permease [Bacteroidetes bacterium]|nr:ABC transporter permease [Bacteroidota bacterium]